MTLKELSNLEFEQQKKDHPLIPEFALVKKIFRDKKANDLTKCITMFLRLKGAYADRINNMGVFRPGYTTDRYHEVLIEKGKFTKSGTRKGIADIMGSFKGRMIACEVKIGKDRQSDDQIKIMNEINASGGWYIIAKSWEDFYSQWSFEFGNQ